MAMMSTISDYKESLCRLCRAIMDEDITSSQGSHNCKSRLLVWLLGGEDLPRKYRIWLLLEVVVLCVLMIVVWGLLTIPVVLVFSPLQVMVSWNASCPAIHVLSISRGVVFDWHMQTMK
jgi:hypothetical protein